jgi:hypothetical protein
MRSKVICSRVLPFDGVDGAFVSRSQLSLFREGNTAKGSPPTSHRLPVRSLTRSNTVG